MTGLLLGASLHHDPPALDTTDVRHLRAWLSKIPDSTLVPVQLVRRLLAALDSERSAIVPTREHQQSASHGQNRGYK